jgi:D-proline reductase (dithiol) PrdB
MARMTDLPASEQDKLTSLPCPTFGHEPWAAGPPMAERTVAMVSTAGLMLRGQRPFLGGDKRYRVIPDDAPAADVLMSHLSVNFDRTGFQQDLDVVLPRGPLRTLAGEGVIGAVAGAHYSFMGATGPLEMEPHARALGRRLRDEGVDTALLLPV